MFTSLFEKDTQESHMGGDRTTWGSRGGERRCWGAGGRHSSGGVDLGRGGGGVREKASSPEQAETGPWICDKKSQHPQPITKPAAGHS